MSGLNCPPGPDDRAALYERRGLGFALLAILSGGAEFWRVRMPRSPIHDKLLGAGPMAATGDEGSGSRRSLRFCARARHKSAFSGFRMRNSPKACPYRRSHSRWVGSRSQRHFRSRSACSRSTRGHSRRLGSRSQRWARARSEMIWALSAVSLARLAAAAFLRSPLSIEQAAREVPSMATRHKLLTGWKIGM